MSFGLKQGNGSFAHEWWKDGAGDVPVALGLIKYVGIIAPVCCSEESAEKGKAFNFLVHLRSNPHPWSLGYSRKKKSLNTRMSFLCRVDSSALELQGEELSHSWGAWSQDTASPHCKESVDVVLEPDQGTFEDIPLEVLCACLNKWRTSVGLRTRGLCTVSG